MNDQIQGFRISPQQRRVWSLTGGDGRRAAIAVQLDGRLDLGRLAIGLETLVARHEILRTSFRRLPGMTLPLQVIDGGVAPSLAVHRGGEVEVAALLEAAATATGVALSASIHEVAAERHVLILSLSALCADAVGLDNLVRELGEAYTSGPDATLPAEEDVLQYVVVSDWLNETLEAEDAEAGKRFWRGLVTDPLIPTVRDAAIGSARTAFALSATASAALEQRATRLGTSLSGLLTAAWQVLLWRLYGQAALPVAAVLDGRSTAELATAIGPLSRHLPIASSVEGNATFAQIVTRVEAALQEAGAWQECFAADELLGGEGPARFLPFAIEVRTGGDSQQFGDVSARVLDSVALVDRSSLLLRCVRGADGLAARLQHDPARFAAAEVARIAARFQVLVTSILEDADVQVAALGILPADEARIVVVDFNDTAVGFDGPHVIHQRFEAQVVRTPDQIAVAFEGQSLSYRQLDARANQLAHRLGRHGVAAGVPVGLLMERSIDMVVGILGILKAGGAYIPLDAEYPQDRLAYMLADSAATVLVTQDRLLAALSSPPSTVIRLDADGDAIATEPTTAPGVATDPEDLAYVLYTSGSTGRPKGVMIPHRALCNHMQWMQQRFPMGPGDSVLQKTPFSFDASVWEFYAPLFSGGRLVMAAPGGHRDTGYLRETIVREGITTIQLVPTLLRMLLDDAGLERCTSLGRVFCGGEALPVDLRDRFQRAVGAELINLYGPTETTIDATFHVCRRGDASVPIGRPIANTEIYLLDERRQPVPLGAAGELYVGGLGVGLGYLHNPTLTAERFLADPFRGGAARMYRTGDLGRHLADGSIEYLGRADNQIKLRGHRIELGEIESTLARYPQIQECVVVVREDQPGDRRLAAYFVPRAGIVPRAAELRSYLKEQLPEYMVPSGFVKLDALPLMPNGKVDQRALPVPDESGVERTGTFVAPRNPMEREVAQIWSEVLGIAQVGIHDDFFELGGHSLIATQLTSRIRKVFHVDLPLRELFAAPTVLGLAERIARLQGELAEQGAMAEVLAELEGLSDDEARALLGSEAAASA